MRALMTRTANHETRTQVLSEPRCSLAHAQCVLLAPPKHPVWRPYPTSLACLWLDYGGISDFDAQHLHFACCWFILLLHLHPILRAPVQHSQPRQFTVLPCLNPSSFQTRLTPLSPLTMEGFFELHHCAIFD